MIDFLFSANGNMVKSYLKYFILILKAEMSIRAFVMSFRAFVMSFRAFVISFRADRM